MGSGQQPMAWIHVKDLAEMIKYSIEEEAVSGVLNGVAPQLITNKVSLLNAWTSVVDKWSASALCTLMT